MEKSTSPKLQIRHSEPEYTEYSVPRSFSNLRGRQRSGSFVQHIDAFEGDKRVGSAKIHHHANDPKFRAQSDNPTDSAFLKPGTPATYLSRIDNFTQNEFKQVKGVGSALMTAVEDRAKEVGSTKVALTPSPGTIKRPKFGAEDMALIEHDPHVPETSKFETISYDPTGFYQKLGYGKDEDERQAHAHQYKDIFTEAKALREVSASKTNNMSKLF